MARCERRRSAGVYRVVGEPWLSLLSTLGPEVGLREMERFVARLLGRCARDGAARAGPFFRTCLNQRWRERT